MYYSLNLAAFNITPSALKFPCISVTGLSPGYPQLKTYSPHMNTFIPQILLKVCLCWGFVLPRSLFTSHHHRCPVMLSFCQWLFTTSRRDNQHDGLGDGSTNAAAASDVSDDDLAAYPPLLMPIFNSPPAEAAAAVAFLWNFPFFTAQPVSDAFYVSSSTASNDVLLFALALLWPSPGRVVGWLWWTDKAGPVIVWHRQAGKANGPDHKQHQQQRQRTGIRG